MRTILGAAFTVTLLGAPVQAGVIGRTENSFAVGGSEVVVATPDRAWRTLVTPAQWWNKDHTWSNDAANLTIDPRPGGCFCEVLPATSGVARGGVEHMHVVFVRPGRQLRMKGALGPLQSEAVEGTLTVNLEPVSGGTRIEWSYTVGGYMRFKTEEIAPAVDKVLGEQFGALAVRLGKYRPG